MADVKIKSGERALRIQQTDEMRTRMNECYRQIVICKAALSSLANYPGRYTQDEARDTARKALDEAFSEV